jgi:hypothetical protein
LIATCSTNQSPLVADQFPLALHRGQTKPSGHRSLIR